VHFLSVILQMEDAARDAFPNPSDDPGQAWLGRSKLAAANDLTTTMEGMCHVANELSRVSFAPTGPHRRVRSDPPHRSRGCMGRGEHGGRRRRRPQLVGGPTPRKSTFSIVIAEPRPYALHVLAAPDTAACCRRSILSAWIDNLGGGDSAFARGTLQLDPSAC